MNATEQVPMEDGWDIESIMARLRGEPNRYMHFLWEMGPAFMGVTTWARTTKHTVLSDFVNVNDEGFLLLTIDNYHERWEAIAERMRNGVSLVRDERSDVDCYDACILTH